jgi:soluble lytic murein transglycosylase-like protein
MVKRTALAALALACAATTDAGAADWRDAGGPLFAGAEDAQAPAPLPDTPVEGRIPTPQQPYADAVAAAADRYGLDPKLLHALVAVESSYNAHAVSPAGAGGLTQLMPSTAATLGVKDRFAPPQAVLGGAAYLAQQVRRFKDLRLALAAYNAGPVRVAAGSRVPEIAETRAFVSKVLECYLALAVGRSIRTTQDCGPGGW